MCLHGLGRSPADWTGVRSGLEAFGEIRVPALPRNPSDALKRAANAVEPGAIVVGHSIGGVLALRLAGEASRPLRAVVLTGCFFAPARNGRSLGASAGDSPTGSRTCARSIDAEPAARVRAPLGRSRR